MLLSKTLAFCVVFLSSAAIVGACRSGDASTDTNAEAPAPDRPAVDAGAVATATNGGGSRAAGTGTDAAPATPPAPRDPGPPTVQFIGRFDTRDRAGPIAAWPGCRIVARFSGTSVSTQLHEIVDGWMEGTPSEWDVAIDGALQTKLVTMANATTTHVLASGLAVGEHTVELYRRSEAQTGVTQFLGFDFDGGTLLPPPLRTTRRIEIVGDSAASGFGVEGASIGPDCPGTQWAAQWENFHKSFGAVLGAELDAEVMGTAYSGKGIVQDIAPSDTDTMPLVFPRANPLDESSAWNFASYVSDVVLIMIGGNDFALGQPVDEGPATPSAFTDAYDAFVVAIRAKYPAATIVLVTSGSLSDSEPPGRNTRTNVMAGIAQVLVRRQAAGDTRVVSAAPRIALPSELTGCNGHGTPAYHQRVADELAVTVRAATGW